MLLPTLLAVAALPACLSLDARAPGPVSRESLLDTARGANASYLETLSTNQRGLFDYVLDALDDNFSPPFLVRFILLYLFRLC
jgi:hypothetical protein